MDYSGKIITKNPVEPSQTSAPGVWTLDQATQAVQGNNWPIAYVPNPISRSLRFNSADTTYLNRTPATAGSLTTWTWSGWVKRSGLGASQTLFSGGPGGSDTAFTQIALWSDDKLRVGGWSTTWRDTTQVFRDVGSWYHFVIVWDTTNGTAADKVRIYVNGTQITAFGTSNSPTNSGINQAAAHAIGRDNSDSTKYLNGYLTEVNFIDGQALTPSSFGLTDPRTGAWIPKKYSGTYGTNGFYLNFSDNSSTAALGTDYSGNSNTWTTNNFSVTAGSGNDSMTDVPTPWIPYNTTGDVGGVVRGNYTTWNAVNKQTNCVLANGNLDWSCDNTNNGRTVGTIAITSGKWYWEVTQNTANRFGVGVIDTSQTAFGSGDIGSTSYEWGFLTANALTSPTAGQKIYNGSATNYGSVVASGEIIMLALDADNGKVYFGKNGTWFDSSNPATQTNPAFSSVTGTLAPSIARQTADGGATANFGQRPFAYTPPAGFKSLCTTNLPEPTILDGGDYFNAVLYTGTGSARSVTGVGFAPNFTWIKVRSAAYDHQLYDIIRGAGKYLYSNSTVSEQTDINQLSSFDSDGFSLGSGVGTNESSQTFVSWNWKANGAGSSNTAGTITSTVSANQTAGFSIVSWTANGSANQSIGHGLGATPSMIITKNRDGVYSWATWFKGFSADEYILLNTTDAKLSYSSIWYQTPTSSVFYVGSTATGINHGTDKNIAYCFAPVAGYSAFGSYVGNGSSDGTFVYTGFRPSFVLTKNASGAGFNWVIQDTSRNPYNLAANKLEPNQSNAESSSNDMIDILSNGFKLKTADPGNNANGSTYIYMAFAENPFKFSNAR